MFPILASKRHDDDRPQLTASQLHGNRAVQPLLNASAEPGPTGTKDETSSVDGVDGAAICVERIFLPDDCADEIPHDPEKAAAFVAAHPKRQEVRVVAGALRDGSHYGVARLVEHPDELLGSIDLVPALESAVLETLR